LRIFAIAFVFSLLFSALPASGQQEYKQLRSEHFFINYHPDVKQDYVYRIKSKAEGFYKIITNEFNFTRHEFWLWENRAEIFIAKDRQDYLDRFRCSKWSGACVNYQKKVIYTYPDQKRFVPILAHELTHIIFREFMGAGEFPLWLDEGMATYIEDKRGGGPYRESLSLIKQSLREGSYIKLSELDKITPARLNKKPEEYVNLFYVESFSLVNFLKKKYGEYSFSRFLYYLRQGSSVEEALGKISYGLESFDSLEKLWKKFYQ